MTMVPATGHARLAAFVRGRGEWCLSRQRSWGVPIPAFYRKGSGEALLTEESVAHVQQLVAAHGSATWWELPISELLPPSMSHQAAEWERGADTLDVWFDSGTSWASVLRERAGEREARADGAPPPLADLAGETSNLADLEAPPPLADLYLEGSDQHRGWFQSSLLTHVGARGGGAPYGAVVTHGFVVDERGAKMSKSVGNVITPADLLEGGAAAPPPPAEPAEAADVAAAGGGKGSAKKRQKQARRAQAARTPYGADVLRLWVAMSDWRGDVALGDSVLEKTRESYRRLRNACRFCLSNLVGLPS